MYEPPSGCSARDVVAPNDLAHLKPAAGDEGEAGLRPVIASGIAVDLRSPTVLAPDHDSHILVQAAFVQIGHQGMNALVEQGEHLPQRTEIIRVGVPVAGGQHSDHRDSGFDETPSLQKPRVSTVLFPNRLRFLADIEGVSGTRRTDDVQGLRSERVHPGKSALRPLDGAVDVVEGTQQRLALGQPVERHLIGQT